MAATQTAQEKSASRSDTVNRYIGSRLQTVRKTRGISQKELIYRLATPVSQQLMSSYEKGHTPIPAYLLFEISQILGVTAETFLPCTQEPHGEKLLDKKTLEGALNAAMESFAKVSSIEPEEQEQLRKLLNGLYTRS